LAVRRVTSQLITWISAGLLSAVLFGPVGQFAVELVRQKGWYDDPSRRLETIAAWFGSFVTQTPFLVVTALSAGLAIGLWLDTYLRYRERQSGLRQYQNRVDRVAALSGSKRRALTRDLRTLNSGGDHNVHLLVSSGADLPFAEAIASCFQRAGWETRVDQRPRPIRPGETQPWNGIRVQGFNNDLVTTVRSTLGRAGISSRADFTKRNEVARDHPSWRIVERRIRLWIGQS
jgi:hypothetical protein